jgi:hypothetical protein
MFVKTEVDGLVKDTESGAILNVNNDKLAAYRKQKMFLETQKTFMDERNKDSYRIQKVENDLSEIKHMLQELLRERNK